MMMSALFLAGCWGTKDSGSFFDDEEEEADSLESSFSGDTLHLFEEEEIPVSVDELFDDFFFSFADDPHFQSQRINFPLACKDGDETISLSKQEWKEYNRFNTQDFYSVIYEREEDLELQKDTTIQEVGVEWIYLQENYVEKFNFRRMNGKWTLVDIVKESEESTPNGDFLKFYAGFIADSISQRESISQPLKLILTATDGEDEQVEQLTIDQWYDLKKDLPFPKDALVNIDYGQSSISQNRKTLLMEGVSNGLQMKFKFDKRNGEWKLIEIEY